MQKSIDPKKNSDKIKPGPTLLGICFIFIAAFLVYAGSLKGQFIWDDDFLIKNNKFITEINADNVTKIFSSNIGSGAGRVFKPYRPVQILSYALDDYLWGDQVFGYHLTNVLLHIGTALAVFWLINILFGDITIAFAASMLFVVHPVHTEAVAYISGRADPLSVLFLLLSLIFYIKFYKSTAPAYLVLLCVSSSAALFSREMSVILPFLIIFWHAVFKEKIRFLPFLPVIISTVVFLVARSQALSAYNFAETAPAFADRLPGVFAAIARYIHILIYPAGLHMGYGDKIFSFGDARVLAGIALLCAAIFLLYKTAGKNRIVSFGAGWFFITLMPQSNIYPVSAYMAEHWLYLPSVGYFLVIGYLIKQIYNMPKFRYFAAVVFWVAVIFYSHKTVRQNDYWRDPETFYENTIKYEKDNPKLYVNFGSILFDKGRYGEAEVNYKKAIELDPKNAYAYYDLGNVYFETGKKDEASALFRQAVGLKPQFREARERLRELGA